MRIVSQFIYLCMEHGWCCIDETVFYGTKLRYAAILVNTTLSWDNISYTDGIATLGLWDDFLDRHRHELAPSLRNVYVATPDRNGVTFGMLHYFKIQEVSIENPNEC